MKPTGPKIHLKTKLLNLSGLNIVRLLGLLLLVAMVQIRLQDPDFLRNFRFQVFDYYQRIQPREYVPQPVTIIDLDEKSLSEVGQWPWPRTKVAQLIDNLGNTGAASIAFDVVFSELDRLSPALVANDNTSLPEDIREKLKQLPSNELAMADAIRRHRVVMGQTSVRSRDYTTEDEREVTDAPHAKIGEDPTPFLDNFPALLQNLPELEEAATGRGVFSIDPDTDGIVRHVPLVLLVDGKIRPSLSLEALRVAFGEDSIAIRTGVAGVEGIIVAGALVDTDEYAKVWPYFSTSQRERYISASDIIYGRADPNRIANHIILVGTSAVGLEDYRPIPLGMQVPGVEVHAQVIENILSDTLLSRSPRAILFELIATFFAGLVIIVLGYRLGAAGSTLIALGMIGLAIAHSWWSFSNQRILFDVTWALMTLGALSIFGGAANYIREERQRQQIQGAFGQYLSPALVEQLSENPAQLVLGGESRELSVLFTDVRGFTTISESYRENPQGLTRLMNEFLTVLSQPILRYEGTIDKYMGDAIMAFWNAPLNDPMHAERCCRAALEMIQAVEDLNEKRLHEIDENSDETYHKIKVGIGVNTGLCVVGNMGSDLRFDYTALGDTVNLASRLEGQSKPYGLPIVMGDATAMEISDRFATFEIDLIRVKGKNEPARIHCLAGDETLAGSDDFKAFRAVNKTMITAYRSRDWDSAFEALEMVEELGEKLSIPVSDYIFIYEARIVEFRDNPPGRDWDGVYTATSK